MTVLTKTTLSEKRLRELAALYGLSIIGISTVEPLSEDVRHLASWQSEGMAGQMSFMERSPDLLTAPLNLLGDARSIVVFSIRYDTKSASSCPEGFGRVARYAWGRDYHRVLRKLLARFLESLNSEMGVPVSARHFSDAVPLLERALAKRAGLGFIGKNSMLIRPKIGSFFFIAEILLAIDIERETAVVQSTQSCGSCTRCKEACPTGALVADRVLDARKCISYLTIEKGGLLEEWERTALGEWIFGCDICQEVCPFNYRSLKEGIRADLEDLRAERGVGPLLSLTSVLGIRCNEEFERRFAGTPLMRPGREGLLRNAAVVAGNTQCKDAIPALELCLSDSEPVIQEHAQWALERI